MIFNSVSTERYLVCSSFCVCVCVCVCVSLSLSVCVCVLKFVSCFCLLFIFSFVFHTVEKLQFIECFSFSSVLHFRASKPG